MLSKDYTTELLGLKDVIVKNIANHAKFLLLKFRKRLPW